MTIKIGEVEPLNYNRNVFVAELRFMHGDADHYTTETFELADEAQLREFDAALRWLHEQDPHYDRLGEYADRTGETMRRICSDRRYTRWFESYQPADFEEDRASGCHQREGYTYEDALADGWGEDLWPSDQVYRGNGSPASFQYVTYYWYDEGGQRRKVTLED